MCSVTTKTFEKTTEILPLATYGLIDAEDYRKVEGDQHHQELLKGAGLTNEEISLYNEKQSGLLKRHNKIESSILKDKIECIENKINNFVHNGWSKQTEKDLPREPAISSNSQNDNFSFYPKGHPMHQLKELEESLFGHLNNDQLPITKRRKLLRRLERKKERIMSQRVQVPIKFNVQGSTHRLGSLWDIKEMPCRTTVNPTAASKKKEEISTYIIGPKKPTMYTIKDNKIVRLEPENNQNNFKAVDIIVPVNRAEAQLLEGTKMSVDDIKKIDRFKDYQPGAPSKVLYLKNIAPSVTQNKLSLLFNRFILDNRGPIDVRLLSGRMRGQAFVAFQNETVAINALEELNGTILSGRPIIVQFGKNSNRIQLDGKS